MQGELNVDNPLTTTHLLNLDYLVIVYTRFVGGTDTRGSRIVATSNYFGTETKVSHNYRHEHGGTENHMNAAFKLMEKFLGKHFELVGQSDHPRGSGMALVFKRKEV